MNEVWNDESKVKCTQQKGVTKYIFHLACVATDRLNSRNNAGTGKPWSIFYTFRKLL